jgi:uncharacterized protein YjiS (DUF1127 family)
MRRTWLALFGAFIMKTVHAYQRRRATSALDQLPDHMLRDIGISRGQIERVVAKGRFD